VHQVAITPSVAAGTLESHLLATQTCLQRQVPRRTHLLFMSLPVWHFVIPSKCDPPASINILLRGNTAVRVKLNKTPTIRCSWCHSIPGTMPSVWVRRMGSGALQRSSSSRSVGS